MIIEFCGLPGVGKSTIARALEKKNYFRIVKLKSKKELFFYNFIFLLKYPIKFFVLLFYVFKNSNGFREFYLKFMNTFLHHNAKYLKALKYKNAIIDQGHFQNFISVFNNKISESEFDKYLKILLKPDKLIIFDLDEVDRKNRMKKRGFSFREDLGKGKREKWEILAKNNVEFLKNRAKENSNCVVVKNEEVEKTISEIL